MKHRLAVLTLSVTVLLAGCTMWREHQVSEDVIARLMGQNAADLFRLPARRAAERVVS